MITLITGLPGHGKSLYAVSTIQDRAAEEGREVYYSGIADLKLPWIPLAVPTDWHLLPPASIIVMDECQRIFPVRSAKDKVPFHCSEFETHRHKGFDIYLITQDAMLLDHHVRRLVGQHYHLKRPYGMSWANIYEFQAATDFKDYHERKLAVKTKFKYPPKNFGLYKSAEIHTVKRRLPKKLIIIPVLISVIGIAIYFFYSTLFSDTTGLAAKSAGASTSVPSLSSDPLGYLTQYRPVDPDRPESAPAYSAMAVPVDFPRVEACVVFADRCTCYSQQGTRLEVTPLFCRNFAVNPSFNNYLTSSESKRPLSISSNADNQPHPAGGLTPF